MTLMICLMVATVVLLIMNKVTMQDCGVFALWVYGIYTLGNAYFDIAQTEDEIAGYRPIYISMIADSFAKNEYISMKDFTEMFENKLKRTQVRYMIEKLVNDKILSTIGEGKSTKYELNIDKRDNQYYFDLIKNKLIE